MRLGIISDTHGTLRPEVFDAFAEVDHILHAGDVGSIDLLEELEVLAAVTAVYGNTDGFAVRRRCPQVAACELAGFPIVVTHGDQFGTPTPADLHSAFPDAEIVVFGHTHRPELAQFGFTATVMNPGAAGPACGGRPPSVGIVELEVGIPPECASCRWPEARLRRATFPRRRIPCRRRTLSTTAPRGSGGSALRAA